MENRRETMTEKKEKYIKPEMEIIEFEARDVITGSCTSGDCHEEMATCGCDQYN